MKKKKQPCWCAGLLSDDPPADYLGENVELAGAALKDLGRISVGEDCWKEVIDRLMSTMTNSAPTIITRARCGDVLGELGDPRLEKLEWCEVPEGEFLMGCTEEEKETIVDEMIEYWTAQKWRSSSRKELQIRMLQVLPQHVVLQCLLKARVRMALLIWQEM